MLELIPDRMAVCEDCDCTVDVLVRVLPPMPASDQQRAALNLALVLDRSGSMQGPKMDLTRRAAALAVRSLHAEDVVSVVTFDDQVEAVLPSMTAVRAVERLHLLEQVTARGSTALYDGWRQGAAEVGSILEGSRLNRVVLLTDGQANVGETNPDRICDEVHRQASRGVQTSTFGFGNGYNENLLRAMAASGRGNHFYVETPDQLTQFFELELGGLTATVGTRVRVELAPAEGVKVETLMAEVPRNAEGDILLGDLMAGMPTQTILRLSVPKGVARPIEVTLHYFDPSTGNPEKREAGLTLPVVSSAERREMATHPEVSEQVAIAVASRARAEAMQKLDKGDPTTATQILKDGLEELKKSPVTPELNYHQAQLTRLLDSMQRQDYGSSRKMSSSYGHMTSVGSSSVVLSNPRFLLETWIQTGHAPLVLGPLFDLHPTSGGEIEWVKVEGMIRGIAVGEQLALGKPGECTAMAMATLDLLLHGTGLARLTSINPTEFGTRFQDVAGQLSQPSPSLQHMLALSEKPNFMNAAQIPDAWVLGHLPPVLLPFVKKPGMKLWAEIVMLSMMTHRDHASLLAALGYGAILWDLLIAHDAPDPEWYLARFLGATSGLELEVEYTVQTGRHDGSKHKFRDYVKLVVSDATQRGLPVDKALLEWGSGAYVLESVPALLYILTRHAAVKPAAALEKARGSALLSAAAGAAVGALHGKKALPKAKLAVEKELAALLQEAQGRWG